MILLHCRCIGYWKHILSKLFYLFLYMDNTCNVSCLATLDKKNHIKDGSKRKDWTFNTDGFNRSGNGRIVRVNGYFCTTSGIENKYFYNPWIDPIWRSHKTCNSALSKLWLFEKYINHMINLLLIKRI